MYSPQGYYQFDCRQREKNQKSVRRSQIRINTWWKKTDVPQKGDALLFTGLMYQFVPYIETSTSYLARFEDTPVGRHLKYGKYIPKLLSGLGLAAITPGARKKAI
jgi:hypothetical protein